MTKKKEETKPRQVTHVVIVLDKSGSMCGTQDQTVKGVNEQIQTARKNAKDQDIFLSLVSFDDDVWEHFWEQPAADMQDMPAEAYNPNGSTALWDGAFYAIDKLKKTTEAGDNVAYLVIIITDGQENASKHCDQGRFAALRKSLEETGKWTFSMVGADSGYLNQVIRSVGFQASNCALWDNSNAEMTTRGMKRMARASSGYYGARAQGQVMSCCLMSSDMESMADFTSCDDVDNIQPIAQAPAIDLQTALGSQPHMLSGGSLDSLYGTANKVDMSQPGMPVTGITDQHQSWNANCAHSRSSANYGAGNKVSWNS